MLLLVSSAFATPVAFSIGYPCQRLNFAWRNTWTTCSINAFTPVTPPENPAFIPTGQRTVGATTTSLGYVFGSQASYMGTATPSTVGTPNYVAFSITPAGTAGPAVMCANAPNTGSGWTANLRNRCRRMLDSYGALTKACAAPPNQSGARGPSNNVYPDWAPDVNWGPHLTNVQALANNAAFCSLPAGVLGGVPNLGTPATVCPGLAAWFTVVYNSCGFTNNPNLAPNLGIPGTVNGPSTGPQQVNAYFPNVFPINGNAGAPWTTGITVSPLITVVTTAGLGTPIGGGGLLGQTGVLANSFCANTAGAAWNPVGPGFRSSKCRRALDSFGRAAGRCNASPVGAAMGTPVQAGGYLDPLRLVAIGHSTTAVTNGGGQSAWPDGANSWVPNCN